MHSTLKSELFTALLGLSLLLLVSYSYLEEWPKW